VTGIGKVWIEEGCISCKVCEDVAPKVFHVEGDETCVVRPDAGAWFESLREDIEEAAADCPVEVIHIEYADRPATPDQGAPSGTSTSC
jgi:ferredoxin